MTITLAPDVEKRLRDLALREGEDFHVMADRLLAYALDEERRDAIEAIEGIRRGLADSDAGRVRYASEVLQDLQSTFFDGVGETGEITARSSWGAQASV